MRKNETDQREILMDALLNSPDVSAAAEKAEVSRATVYRWLSDADFAAELKKKRDAMLDSAIESVKSHSVRAADTLAKILGMTLSTNNWKASGSRKKLVTPMSRSRNSASPSTGDCCKYFT